MTKAEELAKQLYPDPKLEDYDDILVYRADRDSAIMGRVNVVRVYELAEKDLGWHSVDESLPPVDEEVVVLADRLNLGALFAISFGHIVDRMHCSDYNGWNIPGVKYWMPMPKIKEEEQ